MPVLGIILIVFSMGNWESWGETDAVAVTARFKTMRECREQTVKTAFKLQNSGRQLDVISWGCFGPNDVEA
jgi:hypothetical protein